MDRELEDDINAESKRKENVPDDQNSMTQEHTNLDDSDTKNFTTDENRSKKQEESDKQQKELMSSTVRHKEFPLLNNNLEQGASEYKHCHEEQKQQRPECVDVNAEEFEQILEENKTKAKLGVSVTTAIEGDVTIQRDADGSRFDQAGHSHSNTPMNERHLQTTTQQNSSLIESGLVGDGRSLDSNMSFIILDNNNSLQDNLQSGHEEEENFPHKATTNMDTNNSMYLSSIESNRSESFSLLSLPNDSSPEATNGQGGSLDLEKTESRPCSLGECNGFKERGVQSGLPTTDPTEIDICGEADGMRISENISSLEMDPESGKEIKILDIESKRLETRLSPDEKKDKKSSTDEDNDKEHQADEEFDIEHHAVENKIENSKNKKECLAEENHSADESKVEECPANEKEDKECISYHIKSDHPADRMKEMETENGTCLSSVNSNRSDSFTVLSLPSDSLIGPTHGQEGSSDLEKIGSKESNIPFKDKCVKSVLPSTKPTERAVSDHTENASLSESMSSLEVDSDNGQGAHGFNTKTERFKNSLSVPFKEALSKIEHIDEHTSLSSFEVLESNVSQTDLCDIDRERLTAYGKKFEENTTDESNEKECLDKKDDEKHSAHETKAEENPAENIGQPSEQPEKEHLAEIGTEESTGVKEDKEQTADEQDVDGETDTENSADEKDKGQYFVGEIDFENSAEVKEDKEHLPDENDEGQFANEEIENSVDEKEDIERPVDEKDKGQDADWEINTENFTDEQDINKHPEKKDKEPHVDETKIEENVADNRKDTDCPGEMKKEDKLIANKEHSGNQKRTKEHLSDDEIDIQDSVDEKIDKRYADEDVLKTEHFEDEKVIVKHPTDKKKDKEFFIDEKKDEENPDVENYKEKEIIGDEKKGKEHSADEENDAKHTVKESAIEHSISANNELEPLAFKEDCNRYLVVNINNKETLFSEEDNRQLIEDKEKHTLASSSLSGDWSIISSLENSGDPVGNMGQNKDANEIGFVGNDQGFVPPSDVDGDQQSSNLRMNDQTEKCTPAVCLLRELEDNDDDIEEDLLKGLEKLHIEEGNGCDSKIDGEDNTMNRMVRDSSLTHHKAHNSTAEQHQDRFFQANRSSTEKNNEPEIANDDNTFDEDNKAAKEWPQPKDSTARQGEQGNPDRYEIPHYAIVIKRMWTGMRKDGKNFDEVSISLNSHNELCRWNYLFSSSDVLESLRTNLSQQMTVVLRDKGVFVSLSYLGQPFQDLQQIYQWWIQVITTIRKYLAAIKIYKCRFKWLQEKSVLLVLEKNGLIKEKQVVLADTDTASREFSLVGPSSKLNAVSLYLMRELGEIEVWTDKVQINILQFKTDTSNLQIMKKFHLCAILKDQMDLDLFIEEEEFFVIGVIKQDIDKIKELLQTKEWMYKFVSKQVLIDIVTVEMLQYNDNLNYVKEQLEYTGLSYHMEFSAKHVTLFAESDEAANELVKSVTGCFRDCTFKFLKQQEPKKGIDAILEKYGTMVHAELISKEYELCVHLWARADKFEGVRKEIYYFKSQLDDQLEKVKSKTKVIEVDKHVYHFLRRHKNEDLEKVKIAVEETSKDRNVLTMHVTGMSSAIKSICDMINNVREDLVTKCVAETFDKARTDEFVWDLENKYQCSILMEESTDVSAADPDDDVKPSDDCQLVTQSWNYNGTSISVMKCDINKANVDFVVIPVAGKTFGPMKIEGIQKWKTVCRLGIPEFLDKGKEKTNLQDAFWKLYEYLKNKVKGENTVAIPVYGVCNWDYKKFVKNLLFPIKSLLPRIVLCVPNDDVKKEVIKIISDARGGPVTIFVKLGDITKEKVDVIVNTTSKAMELEIGGVSLAILKAAGDKIQKQCKRNNSFGEELPAGEIIVTDGFNLSCKKVYHGALRDWSTSDGYGRNRRIDEMKTFIRKCLHEAVKNEMKSLSFPALGTGNLGYPTDQVAEIMLQEIKSFSENQKPDCSLQEVNIVVFGKDHETYEIFKKKYEACVGPLPDSSVDGLLPVQHLRIGETDLEIATGDVKSDAGYEGLVLMWTAEDIRDNSAGAMDIIRDAGKEILSLWNKSKDKLHGEKYLVLNGGNLQFRNILNVCIDRDQLQEGFTVAFNVAEAYGLSSVIFSLRDKETKSVDLDKYALALYKALKSHECSLPTSLRIKICIESPVKCDVVQRRLAYLEVTDSPTASKVEEVQLLPRKIVYMVTGKKKEVDSVIKALTDDNVTKEMEQAEVTDDQNLDRESLLVEKMTKAEDGYDGKTDEFENDEDMYSKEADAVLECETADLQNTFVKSEVPEVQVPPQESGPVRLQTRLPAVGDSERCVLAVSRKHCNESLEENLENTLKPKPVAIICPHEEATRALVVYDDKKDSTSVLQNQEIKAELQKLDITLKPMPPQVICNLEAGLDITKLVLAGCRTLQPHVIEQSLRECSGVKIQKASNLWYLKGTMPQLRRASDYLSGLIVKFRTSRIVANSAEDNIAVTVERVTPALYGAYCFFTSNSDDKDSLSALNFDKKRQCVTIKGTNEKVQKVKKSLERILKCECQSINVSSKSLSVWEMRNKLGQIQTDYPHVYFHLKTNNNETVEDVTFLGLDGELVKKVKVLAFDKLGLATNRRSRFAQSDGARPKDSFVMPSQFGAGIGEKDQSYSLRAGRDKELNLPTQRSKNISHYKAADIFDVLVYQGDILDLEADCIVNAANSKLDHGGGVASAIAEAAGPRFVNESKQYIKDNGEVKVGHSCHTGAGKLKYRYVIHTVGPRWNDYPNRTRSDICSELLCQAVESAILEANKCRVIKVAIPAISSGIYGVPHEICVTQYTLGIIGACSKLENQKDKFLKEIHFVDKNAGMINMIKAKFQELLCEVTEAEPDNFPDMQDDGGQCQEYSQQRKYQKNFWSNERHRQSQLDSPPPQKMQRMDHDDGNDRHHQSSKVHQHSAPMLSRSQSYDTGRSEVYPYVGSVIEHEVFKHIYQLNESTQIQVYSLDILDCNVDALVFGEDKELSTKSRIGRAIREIDKKAFDAEIKLIKGNNKKIKIGKVCALQLKCVRQKVILLLVTPSWGMQGTTAEDCLNGIKRGITAVLKRCSELGQRSIAMPILGTGNTGAQIHEVSEIIIDKIQEYFSTSGGSCPIKQVHIVSKDESNIKILTNILDKYVGKFKRFDQSDIIFLSGKKFSHQGFDNAASLGSSYPANRRNNNDMLSNLETAVQICSTQQKDKSSLKGTQGGDNQKNPSVICLENITGENYRVLPKGNHVFHRTCINEQFENKPASPTCNVTYGNQPKTGNMQVVRRTPPGVRGFENVGVLVITYSFPDGIQSGDHPNPGFRYKGTRRECYLPDTERGNLILEMLRIAFDRRLTFTVGRSRTTGEANVVIWNDIHHKTSYYGGEQGFGYPDDGYFDRVTEELRAKGITPADIQK